LTTKFISLYCVLKHSVLQAICCYTSSTLAKLPRTLWKYILLQLSDPFWT